MDHFLKARTCLPEKDKNWCTNYRCVIANLVLLFQFIKGRIYNNWIISIIVWKGETKLSNSKSISDSDMKQTEIALKPQILPQGLFTRRIITQGRLSGVTDQAQASSWVDCINNEQHSSIGHKALIYIELMDISYLLLSILWSLDHLSCDGWNIQIKLLD